MIMKTAKYCVLCLIAVLAISGCSKQNAKRYQGNEVMVASISSNGRYVITTNANRHAYLWDLKKHTQKQLSTYPVNIYSAYFVKNKKQYLIQDDKTNQVLVQNTQGKTIKQFNPDFPTYGEIMTTDGQYWFGADESFNVYRWSHGNKKQVNVSSCIDGQTGEVYQGPLTSECTGFMVQLMHLNLSPNDKYLTASDALTHLYIWNVKTRKGVVKKGHGTKTVNDISPDGHYVVTGDVDRRSIVYNLKQQKIIQDIAIETPKTSHIKSYFEGPYNQNTIDEITGLNFISEKNYLVSFRGSGGLFRYLAMFKVNDVKTRYLEKLDSSYPATFPIKYLKLDTKTITVHKNGKTHKKTIYPETQSFLRSQSFDTAPQANRVVMGQANGGGIMVYQYDPDKQKLKLIWAPQLKEHKGYWWQFWK